MSEAAAHGEQSSWSGYNRIARRIGITRVCSLIEPGAAGHLSSVCQNLKRIENSQLTKLFVSDTIRFKEDGKTDKVSVITVSEIFAEAIRRTFNNESISSLFDIDKG